jgi:hypothetical protein
MQECMALDLEGTDLPKLEYYSFLNILKRNYNSKVTVKEYLKFNKP